MKKIISSVTIVFLFFACKKSELPGQNQDQDILVSANKPSASLTVTTTSVNVGSINSASANGSVSGGNISERGFCYSLTPGPTIASDTARAGSGSGIFQRLITGLTEGTTYYLKAYAIKNNVAYYGNELSFTTLTLGMPSPGVGTVYDMDGNAYTTVTLGTQVWMVENLKTTRYRNGDAIANITDNTAWTNATSGAYCDYNNDPANSVDNGRLYNLHAVKDSRGLAPTGWHIPNGAEWNTLINYLGGGGTAGRLKETGFTHWDPPNTGADNSSLFTAFGSGNRVYGTATQFYNLKIRAMFWSSSSNLSGSFPYIHAYSLYSNSSSWAMQSGAIQGGQAYGYAVRCVMD